jgi:iron complex outermembrane receptor protein
MKSNPKLCYSIAAILGSTSSGTALADIAAGSAAASSGGEIQEITVTAQRRSENLQDVPITIQALTADTLTQVECDDLR